MIDWNNNGKHDSFDDFMDYQIINDTSKRYSSKTSTNDSMFKDSIFSGKRFLCLVICTLALGVFEQIIFDVEHGSIFSFLLAIPVSKVVYNLDRKLGKWDETAEKESNGTTASDEIKPWQYRVTLYFVVLVICSIIINFLPYAVISALDDVFGAGLIVVALGFMVLIAELLFWLIMKDETT